MRSAALESASGNPADPRPAQDEPCRRLTEPKTWTKTALKSALISTTPCVCHNTPDHFTKAAAVSRIFSQEEPKT